MAATVSRSKKRTQRSNAGSPKDETARRINHDKTCLMRVSKQENGDSKTNASKLADLEFDGFGKRYEDKDHVRS